MKLSSDYADSSGFVVWSCLGRLWGRRLTPKRAILISSSISRTSSQEYADTYFGLLEGLQELFKRNVDLVMISAVKNPYFLESIERSRTLLYAA